MYAKIVYDIEDKYPAGLWRQTGAAEHLLVAGSGDEQGAGGFGNSQPAQTVRRQGIAGYRIDSRDRRFQLVIRRRRRIDVDDIDAASAGGVLSTSIPVPLVADKGILLGLIDDDPERPGIVGQGRKANMDNRKPTKAR